VGLDWRRFETRRALTELFYVLCARWPLRVSAGLYKCATPDAYASGVARRDGPADLAQ
jgi:hypothetical protein